MTSDTKRARIVLIGQAPSRRGDPAHPLGSGEALVRSRLYLLSGACSEEQFLQWFEPMNVLREFPGSLDGKGDAFPIEQARARANDLRPQLSGRIVVMLGKKVAQVFSKRMAPFEFQSDEWGTTWTMCPHPSGLNMFWNSAANKAEAARFFSKLIAMRSGDRI